jgi:hypothetical protein
MYRTSIRLPSRIELGSDSDLDEIMYIYPKYPIFDCRQKMPQAESMCEIVGASKFPKTRVLVGYEDEVGSIDLVLLPEEIQKGIAQIAVLEWPEGK